MASEAQTVGTVEERATAPVFYIERDLFDAPVDWKTNKGDSINKPPADYFEASAGNPMLVTNGSNQAWGGALVSRKRGVPVNSATGKLLNWLAFRIKFRFPKGTVDNTARLETDLKVCVKTRPSADKPIRNVCNYSTQWNNDSGQIQIDLDPPAWVDSGFVIAEITPDVWHTLEYRFTFDDVALTFSILSIQYDDRLYAIPAHLQNVPMSLTNWEQVSSLQLQNEVYAARSTVLVEYDEGVLCWSDQRITEIPTEALTRGSWDSEFWWPRERAGKLVGGTFDPFSEGAIFPARGASAADRRQGGDASMHAG